ncbi:MAG: NAD(P)H-quinone oxidoreductase [Candidatus Obscuribacterales bacterium]|nr:NAD(P)H-quinone oxidoreductase [Steroidobacteraceae bacterium]
MKYIAHGFGGTPAAMHVTEGPRPALQAGQVLLEVHYAGVNRPDVAQRMGRYPPPPDASPILGLEVAGCVVEVASDVTTWQVGDAVCALTHGGGYAEYCAADASHCLPVPKGMTLLQAAALPENFFTVWTNVWDRGRLKAGERFLVHGGSSGIGLTAIQLAKAFGARVFTTVGNAEKAAACLAHGADMAVNYKEQDFEKEIQDVVGRQGVDVILDMVGGSYIAKNIRLLGVNGRLVQIAFLEGSKAPDFDLLPVMMKRLTVTGSTLRPRSAADKAAIAHSLRENVWPLLEAGKVKPVIHATFAIAEAAKAHALMETSQHIGKIMLAVKA